MSETTEGDTDNSYIAGTLSLIYTTLSILNVIIIFYSFAVSIIMATVCPNIIDRSAWKARPAELRMLPVNPPTHVIIHHSATANCTTPVECSESVRAFQNYHMDTHKWDDIGYNFVVGEDGNVYEGRGWGKNGAHALHYNSKSIGICFIGTFIDRKPNEAALMAAKQLIAYGVCKGFIKGDYLLIGHRQVKDTECPGKKLFEEIQRWSQWTANP